MKLNTSVLRAQTIKLKSRPIETDYEKSMQLDHEYKLQQSIEDSSINDDSTEPVKVENNNVIDEGEPIAESGDNDIEKK